MYVVVPGAVSSLSISREGGSGDIVATTINVEPGFSRECAEVFADGEFQGDARTIEITDTRARVVYAPVPPED